MPKAPVSKLITTALIGFLAIVAGIVIVALITSDTTVIIIVVVVLFVAHTAILLTMSMKWRKSNNEFIEERQRDFKAILGIFSSL